MVRSRPYQPHYIGLYSFTCLLIFAVTILLVCLVREAESAREPKGSKAAKSSKQESTCKVEQDKDGIYFVKCVDEKKRKKEKGRETQCNTECRGKRGARGQRGKTGPKGQKGQTGPKGSPGDDGRDGRDGLPGPKGPIGPVGKAGLDGRLGTPGIKGQKGASGLRGETGPPGPPGIPGSCVNLTTIKGSNFPSVYCLPGNQGIRGPKGETGERGALGPVGPKGQKGSRGSRGQQGPRGPKGVVGPPGDFSTLLCQNRYTNWINKTNWFREHPDVHCDHREFLQGFFLEENSARQQRRFRYQCCSLQLHHTPGEGQK